MRARTHGLRVYDVDRHEPVHVARRMAEAADYPAYTSFLAFFKSAAEANFQTSAVASKHVGKNWPPQPKHG